MEVLQIKEITLKISIPIKDLQEGKTFKVKVKDDANFIETLAMVDKYIHENHSESIFPIHDGYIHNYLQLIVNIEEAYIYDDVGISPYAPNEEGLLRRFNPIKDDITFSLYPDTVIDIQQDFGC